MKQISNILLTHSQSIVLQNNEILPNLISINNSHRIVEDMNLSMYSIVDLENKTKNKILNIQIF